MAVTAGIQLLESDAIITYLYKTYGDGKVPLALRLGPLTTLSCSIGQLPRINRVRRLLIKQLARGVSYAIETVV